MRSKRDSNEFYSNHIWLVYEKNKYMRLKISYFLFFFFKKKKEILIIIMIKIKNKMNELMLSYIHKSMYMCSYKVHNFLKIDFVFRFFNSVLVCVAVLLHYMYIYVTKKKKKKTFNIFFNSQKCIHWKKNTNLKKMLFSPFAFF